MSKRYTVDETWELCLKMWKWISRQCKGKDKEWYKRNIEGLKQVWLEKNGHGGIIISQNCFFCNHSRRKADWEYNCNKCPARKIDANFYCMTESYKFNIHPRLFYAELKRLNKIRLSSNSIGR